MDGALALLREYEQEAGEDFPRDLGAVLVQLQDDPAELLERWLKLRGNTF